MLNKVRDLKLSLYRSFYNPNTVQQLIDNLNNEFDLFSIDYDDDSKIIQMKIKKTTMKKIPKYNHTSSFYYSIINPIVASFFLDNIDSIKDASPLDRSDTEELLTDKYVLLLYNIIVIGDNIINIQL